MDIIVGLLSLGILFFVLVALAQIRRAAQDARDILAIAHRAELAAFVEWQQGIAENAAENKGERERARRAVKAAERLREVTW